MEGTRIACDIKHCRFIATHKSLSVECIIGHAEVSPATELFEGQSGGTWVVSVDMTDNHLQLLGHNRGHDYSLNCPNSVPRPMVAATMFASRSVCPCHPLI